MNTDPTCLFCKIVARQEPAIILYENDNALVFMDISPIPEGHALVIPKMHCRNLYDFPDDAARDCMRASRIVANALRDALNADGMSFYLASERAGAQHIFHAHFHLYPRWYHDGMLRFQAEPEKLHRGDGSREGMDKLAAKIRSQLKDD